jgi:hypothetical protein
MQRTSSILAWILQNEFHRGLYEFLLVKVGLTSFAVTVALGVLVASRWSCRNSFDFFLFDETKLNLHGLDLVFIIVSLVATFLRHHVQLTLIVLIITFLEVRFTLVIVTFIRWNELFRICVELLVATRSI